MSSSEGLLALIDRWRCEAELFERCGAHEAATTTRRRAEELEAALRDQADQTLTLAEAQLESGYSERRLRELLASGAIPNAGQKGRPRIRRADLPRRARAADSGFDPAREARRLLWAR